MNSIDFVYVIYKNIDFIKISIEQLFEKFYDNSYQINIIIVDNSYPITPKNQIVTFLRYLENYQIKEKISIKYVPSDKNLGFASACNKAALLSNSENIIFLNCDTRFNLTCQNSLINSISLCSYESPIIGVKICDQYGHFTYSAFTHKPMYILTKPLNHLNGFCYHILKKLKIYNHNKYLYNLDLNSNKVFKVDWISGCFMIINRKFFEKIGGFDERFFMYFEDVDICRKVSEMKGKVLYDTNTKLIHYAQLESKKYKSIIKSIFFNKTARYHIISWLKYIFKWKDDFITIFFKKY